MAKTKKHEKKSKKKHKDHDRSRVSKKMKKSKKSHKKDKAKKERVAVAVEEQEFIIPLELMNNKSHAPETPEEYQKRQSEIRREKDPITGRIRLIKGDGEILEEIVSKSQHMEINKLATKGDGKFYEQKSSIIAAKKKY